MNTKLKRGLWSPEEDEKLVNYISTHGLHSSWSAVPKPAGLQRSGKSCRLRWINYLRPGLRKGNFSLEEVMLIINLHNNLGNKWAEIAKHLPGRTDSAIKNFCNSNIKKKLNIIQYQKDFCNQNLNFDLILGQNWNPDSLVMQLEPSEMKGMDLIIDTVSQPNNWGIPCQLQMVKGQNHCAPSSLVVKHGEEIEIESESDVDLPPLPPSFTGDSCSVLDLENFDLILGQNWDSNNLIMQLEPSEMERCGFVY